MSTTITSAANRDTLLGLADSLIGAAGKLRALAETDIEGPRVFAPFADQRVVSIYCTTADQLRDMAALLDAPIGYHDGSFRATIAFGPFTITAWGKADDLGEKVTVGVERFCGRDIVVTEWRLHEQQPASEPVAS